MKKFLKWTVMMSVCAVLFSMVMVSCGDDDDEKNDNNYKELIIGTWTETGDWDGSYSPDGGEYNYGYIFRMNGTCTQFGSGRADGTYSVSGNKLSLQDDYGVETLTIRTLTDRILVLDWGDGDVETYIRVYDD